MTIDKKRSMLYDYCGETSCESCLLRKKEWRERCPRGGICIGSASEKEMDCALNLIGHKVNEESVNHPSHYNQGKYECIEVMVETFGIEAAKNFCLLNAFKYIWRTGEKNGKEDIEKAIWYLNKFLELEDEQHGNLSEQN